MPLISTGSVFIFKVYCSNFLAYLITRTLILLECTCWEISDLLEHILRSNNLNNKIYYFANKLTTN